MNREDIIKLAREASATGYCDELTGDAIERFAALVAAAEREACAMQAWALVLGLADQDAADIVLRAIRARSSNAA